MHVRVMAEHGEVTMKTYICQLFNHVCKEINDDLTVQKSFSYSYLVNEMFTATLISRFWLPTSTAISTVSTVLASGL